jgi:dihydrofolate reductase
MKAIVAISKNNIIGKDGKIPWRCKEDLQFFKKMTLNGKIVVGRKTFEDLPFLPNRKIYVVTRGIDPSEKFIAAVEKWEAKNSPVHIVTNLRDIPEDAFVCGGAELYNTLLPKIDTTYVTIINKEVDGDTLFPIAAFSRRFHSDPELVQEGDGYTIHKYTYGAVSII